MRNPKRIKICIYQFQHPNILSRFLGTSELNNTIYDNWINIIQFWKQNPDLRFGQMLCNMRLIPNLEIENHIWNIEETTWLVDSEYCKFEDINFWGTNFFKTGKPRKKVKWELLKDLSKDHIANIILWFENQDSLNRIPPKYLEYFKQRLNE